MTDQPLVSIITPAYNAARYIEETIESVRRQDYPRIEHVIIDDGSTDDGATAAVLARYPHVRWWSRPNQGQYATMNEGFAASTGEVVLFLSADDLLVAPRSVTRAVAYLSRHADCDGVYGRWQSIDEHSRLLPVQPQIIGRYPRSWFRYLPFISHCAMFVRRPVLTDHLLFDPTLRYTGDADWIERLLRAEVRLCFLNTVMAQYRFHPSQATQSAKAAIWEEKREYFRRYGGSPRRFRLINAGLDWRSRMLRAGHVLRAEGPRGLNEATRRWRARRRQ
jgi:glycosyltransferase involved in cell wall biosynthesis